MGAIVALFLTGLVGVGIYKFLTNADSRSKFSKEFWDTPGESLFILTWVACCLFTFWAIFFPPLGNLTITISYKHYAIWQLTGIVSLVGLIISFMWKGKR